VQARQVGRRVGRKVMGWVPARGQVMMLEWLQEWFCCWHILLVVCVLLEGFVGLDEVGLRMGVFMGSGEGMM